MPSRAGRSAYGVAFMRAAEAFEPAEQRLFEDPVAIDLLPAAGRWLVQSGWPRRGFVAMMERTVPGVRGALLCRTRWIDDAVKGAVERGLERVVLLGAGLDTRAYRLPGLERARVIEVDLAAVQAPKQRRLERALGRLFPNVAFVATDFNTEPLELALRRGGLSRNEPAIFVWEGVSQYLAPPSVDAVLETVAGWAKGSGIVFTYVLAEAIVGSAGGASSDLGRIAQRSPEPWLFGLDPSKLEPFLAARGLVLRADVGAEEHQALLLRPRGRVLSVSPIERIAVAATA